MKQKELDTILRTCVPRVSEKEEQKLVKANEMVYCCHRRNKIKIYLPLSLKDKVNRKIVVKDIDGCEIDLFAFLNSHIEKVNKASSTTIPLRTDAVFLSETRNLILNNISNENLSVRVFSEMMGMSQSRLNVKLKGLTNYTTIEYINSIKMDCARKLIEQGCFSIKEIAYKVGFEDNHYFSRAFKKHFGNCPSYYLPQ